MKRESGNTKITGVAKGICVKQWKAQHEAKILAVPGVVGVETGVRKGGKEYLQIYTTISTGQVLPQLPRELRDVEVALEYIGHINAHPLWYLPIGRWPVEGVSGRTN